MKDYKAAVVGLGVMGCIADGLSGRHPQWYPPCNHADIYRHHPKIQLVSGCSRSTAKREYFQDKYPSVTVYQDYVDLLSQEQIDIISVATPATCHAEIVIAAAEAGVKGIYCEKAMATSLIECDKMIRACQDYGSTLIINHQRRWDNHYIALKHFLDKGDLGDLQTVQISFGNGRLCRGGSHWFDLALMLVDDKIATGLGWLSDPHEFDPGGIGIFETEKGIRIVIDGSIGMNHSCQVDIVGENGIIRIIDDGFQFELWRLDPESEFGLMAKYHLPISYSVSSPMLNAIDNLIDSLQTGNEPQSSGHDGRAAFEMISAIHLSHFDDRKNIPFPIQNRELVINSD